MRVLSDWLRTLSSIHVDGVNGVLLLSHGQQEQHMSNRRLTGNIVEVVETKGCLKGRGVGYLVPGVGGGVQLGGLEVCGEARVRHAPAAEGAVGGGLDAGLGWAVNRWGDRISRPRPVI
jgi:hypothetical protein